MDSIRSRSAQTCGCDPGAGWVCAVHQQKLDKQFAAAAAQMADVQIARKEHAFQKNLIEDSRGALPLFAGTATAALEVAPKGEKPSNPKNPIGSNKVPMHLWPETATALGSMALLDGGLKYGIANYRAAGVRASIYVAALKRHMAAWYDAGEECAEDSGVDHLGHALACLAIIVDAREAGVLVDDRPKSGGFMGLCRRLEQTVQMLRERHKDKNPRHYTVADNGIGTFPDPKERAQS